MICKEQKYQSNQYDFPYHYLASFTENGYSQAKIWTWGLRYLGGIHLMLNALKEYKFNSLCDLGCGDGFFLRHVAERYKNKNLIGIDYDRNAISLARALNPSLEFINTDITQNEFNNRYDIVTMIEVLEHILPGSLSTFLDNAASLLNSDGVLLITVPHTNEEKSEKHFQHFDSKSLLEILTKKFSKVEIFSFDGISKSKYMKRILSIILNLLCDRETIIINHPLLLSLRWHIYVNNFLCRVEESRGRRLFAICSNR